MFPAKWRRLLIWRRPGVSAKMATAIDLRKRPRLFAPALALPRKWRRLFPPKWRPLFPRKWRSLLISGRGAGWQPGDLLESGHIDRFSRLQKWRKTADYEERIGDSE
jgi:hypothetical protein